MSDNTSKTGKLNPYAKQFTPKISNTQNTNYPNVGDTQYIQTPFQPPFMVPLTYGYPAPMSSPGLSSEYISPSYAPMYQYIPGIGPNVPQPNVYSNQKYQNQPLPNQKEKLNRNAKSFVPSSNIAQDDFPSPVEPVPVVPTLTETTPEIPIVPPVDDTLKIDVVEPSETVTPEEITHSLVVEEEEPSSLNDSRDQDEQELSVEDRKKIEQLKSIKKKSLEIHAKTTHWIYARDDLLFLRSFISDDDIIRGRKQLQIEFTLSKKNGEPITMKGPLVKVVPGPIVLNRVENRWKMKKDQTDITDIEILLSKVRGILNKLSDSNLKMCIKQLFELEFPLYTDLSRVVKLIFENAINESTYSKLYATLFKNFYAKSESLVEKYIKTQFSQGKFVWKAEGVDYRSKTFSTEDEALKEGLIVLGLKKLIVSNVQTEFQSGTKSQEVLDNFREFKKKPRPPEESDDYEKYNEEYEELVRQETTIKRKLDGLMNLIGQLYLLNHPIISDTIITTKCIPLLIESNELFKIEALCKLLMIVGRKLDKSRSIEMDSCFAQLKKMYSDRTNFLTSQVRFSIYDVLDARATGWACCQSPQTPGTPTPSATPPTNSSMTPENRQVKNKTGDVRNLSSSVRVQPTVPTNTVSNKPSQNNQTTQNNREITDKSVSISEKLWGDMVDVGKSFVGQFLSDTDENKLIHSEVVIGCLTHMARKYPKEKDRLQRQTILEYFEIIKNEMKVQENSFKNAFKYFIQNCYYELCDDSPLFYIDLSDFIYDHPHDSFDVYNDILLKIQEEYGESEYCFALALTLLMKSKGAQNNIKFSDLCFQYKLELTSRFVNNVIQKVNITNYFPAFKQAIEIRDELLANKEIVKVNVETDIELNFYIILLLLPSKDDSLVRKLSESIKNSRQKGRGKIMEYLKGGISIFCSIFDQYKEEELLVIFSD